MCPLVKVTKGPGSPRGSQDTLHRYSAPCPSHFTSHHGCKSLTCLQPCLDGPKRWPRTCSFLFAPSHPPAGFLPSPQVCKFLSPTISLFACHLLQEVISGLPREELISPKPLYTVQKSVVHGLKPDGLWSVTFEFPGA